MNNLANQTQSAPQTPKLGQVPKLEKVAEIALSRISPTPENDDIYTPFDSGTPENQALIKSLKTHGVKEPLVLSLDFYILSGHRRYGAARAAGLKTVPCRRENVRHGDSGFITLLREYNRQRAKTLSEQLREAVIDADPEEAYQSLMEHRDERAALQFETMAIEGEMKRSRITKAKEPMMAAILDVMERRRKLWPLSDRFIHYQLLNAPPLKHASKPDSTYQNDKASYKALTELLTRARIAGRISMAAISDATRPVTTWDVHQSPSTFFDRELENFLKGYRRNLQQSQPNHIEIIGEKMTVESTLKPVAGRFNIPVTIGRGYSSLEPRYKMFERYKKSGKDSLILLILSDFDPDGEEICQSFARSMRDDFGVWNIEPMKVGVSAEQIRRFNIPNNQLEAKESSAQYAKFVAKHGTAVYELEALEPETIQSELTAAIESVMDVRAFNQELDAEKQDAAFIAQQRQRAHLAFSQ